MSASSPDPVVILEQARLRASARSHRQLVVMAGDVDWSAAAITTWIQRWQPHTAVGIGTAPLPGVECLSASAASAVLGRDLELAIVNAWNGCNPNALAVVAGAVVAGGMLVLCTPPLQQWPDFADPDYSRLLVHGYAAEQIRGRFLRRLVSAVESDQDVLIMAQGQAVSWRETAAAAEIAPAPARIGFESPTAEQLMCIDAVVHVAEGHSRRPLVITADRGRGKSSALGMACARLLAAQVGTIIVTGPGRSAVDQVFGFASRELGSALLQQTADSLVTHGAELRFLPPDELLRGGYPAHLLLVDEAAAIPAPLLEALAERYNRVVYATTVHGYEGTGRGFEIRFRPRLTALSNQVRDIRLRQPVRWAEGDPVERWLFGALLLNADGSGDHLPACDVTGASAVELLDRDQLVADEALLQQLFGLLVSAHYQTTPNDLRNLLDGPNISVWVARCGEAVTGVVLIAAEGGFDTALAGDICRGIRRPRGHLLAQTLGAHSGLQEAPSLRYWRVMRIAVDPRFRRRGVARSMIRAIEARARQLQVDMMGSSFAASADVVAFWRSLQYLPLRVGTKRDASSGCHSAMVGCALSASARALLDHSEKQFAEQFPRALETRFNRIEAELVVALLKGCPLHAGYVMSPQDWIDVETYAHHRRQFEDCRLALWKVVLLALQQGLINHIDDAQRNQLVWEVLQCRSADALPETSRVKGRRALQSSLRETVRIVYEAVLDRPRG